MALNEAQRMQLVYLPTARLGIAADRIQWLRNYAAALLEVDPSGALSATATGLADSLQFALDHGMTV